MLDPNGLVVNWNAGAERIKGYTADEIIGQHFSRFYTGRDHAAGLPARALQTAAQEGRFEGEGWRVRKDGSLFWANAVIDRITDENGDLIGFAKITRDITERRNAQLVLQEAQAQRAQAQKMEALAQLTGGVAHDFNNLLMIVGGHVRTLKKFVATDPKGATAVEAIERAAERGATLTRQLLTFSRRQIHQPVVAEIGKRIEAFRALLEGSIGASVRLISDIPPGVWPVKTDASEFELAILNLTLNARDAMPQGGIVTISAENVRLAANDTPARLEGDFVALSIADRGSGIAPDILPRVFDPFFTTKRANEGSGLGLSQVHGFAHQSGGTVTIRSELGHGTCVTLYLPRAQKVPEQADVGDRVQQLDGGPALLVEDNPDVAKITAQMIEDLGYAVQIVDTASAALELVDRVPFQLVVSDILMAGSMDGIALARALRQRRPDLPIVLVTGYSTSAAAAGTEFTVLRKPCQLSDLSHAMAKAITEVRSPAPSNVVSLHDTRREATHRQFDTPEDS